MEGGLGGMQILSMLIHYIASENPRCYCENFVLFSSKHSPKNHNPYLLSLPPSFPFPPFLTLPPHNFLSTSHQSPTPSNNLPYHRN